MLGRWRQWHPTPMDGGAWWAAVHGVAKSQTRLSNFPFTFHINALEKEMATHSSVLAWRIPGTVEPGGLLSLGSHRVGHNWSNLAAAAACSVGKENACNAGDLGSIPGSGRSPGEGNGNPLQYPCLENPMDRGAWWATVHRVTRVRHDSATKPPPPPWSILCNYVDHDESERGEWKSCLETQHSVPSLHGK